MASWNWFERLPVDWEFVLVNCQLGYDAAFLVFAAVGAQKRLVLLPPDGFAGAVVPAEDP